MKFQFEDDLDYQKAAIHSSVGLFQGQEISRSEFSVTFYSQSMSMDESQPGIGTELGLVDEDIEQNLRKVQLQNGLEPLEWNAKLDGRDFTVEMETGRDVCVFAYHF